MKTSNLLLIATLIVGAGLGFWGGRCSSKTSNSDGFFVNTPKGFKSPRIDSIDSSDAKALIIKYKQKEVIINRELNKDPTYKQETAIGNPTLKNFEETRFAKTDFGSLLAFVKSVGDFEKPKDVVFYFGQIDRKEKYKSSKINLKKGIYNGKTTLVFQGVDSSGKNIGPAWDVVTLCPPDCN